MFLVDTGADSTVLSARILEALGLERLRSLLPIVGIGGATGTVDVEVTIWLTRDGPDQVAFNGRFAAVTDPDALDMSVLGRDILRWFALVVDQPGNTVCLVNQRHSYQITSA
ncbi:MAG: retropepsin-like aspartic protease [Chloroflexota bacterium]